MTGKIRGFSFNFCNLKLRESQLELSYLAHNMFGFDFYFILKGIRTSAWVVKKLSIGESKLANINFANISNKLKFLYTYKYFQTSLSSLAGTIDEKERNKIELLLKQFISQHDHFSIPWQSLSIFKKYKMLNILSISKWWIPYEKLQVCIV